jgi:hypothetical protein
MINTSLKLQEPNFPLIACLSTYIVCIFPVDVPDRGSTSSLSSLGESKSETKTTAGEETGNLHELDLTALCPYPQQLTLIKGHRYYPGAYLSIRILTQGEEGMNVVH